MVKYYDYTKHNGSLTVFHKEKVFEHQNEFRILLETTGEEPLKVKVPGLRQVSTFFHDLTDPKIKFENPTYK
jgi:hypothetical protein